MGRLDGVKVAILAANGVEQIELESPKHALEKEGAQTVLISPEKKQVQGWHHTDKGDFFQVDCALDEADPEDYDALLLPGGVMNPDRLRSFPTAAKFVKTMHEQDKPIAAICHGPWMLINAEAVDGCKLTSWSSIKLDLVNAGAKWVDEPVVCDHHILTSRKPDDLPAFNAEMINLFASKSY